MIILLIEDNNAVGSATSQSLGAAGYKVEWRRNFETAHELAIDPQTELVVIDRGLPDGDGLDIVRQLRAASISTPILMISERNSVPDRVAGLESGADDYLIKPFAFPELVARCRALLRRPRMVETDAVRFGAITLKPDTLELSVRGKPLAISRREGQLLVALLRRSGRVCTRAYLEGLLYDQSTIVVSPNALETSMSRLRSCSPAPARTST